MSTEFFNVLCTKHFYPAFSPVDQSAETAERNLKLCALAHAKVCMLNGGDHCPSAMCTVLKELINHASKCDVDHSTKCDFEDCDFARLHLAKWMAQTSNFCMFCVADQPTTDAPPPSLDINQNFRNYQVSQLTLASFPHGMQQHMEQKMLMERINHSRKHEKVIFARSKSIEEYCSLVEQQKKQFGDDMIDSIENMKVAEMLKKSIQNLPQ